MDENRKPTPFGLLFEEAAPSPQAMPIPKYDEETDLSYVTDLVGTPVPFVEADFWVGTQTFTAVQAEETDSDQDPTSPPVLTATATRVQGETTDHDSAISSGPFLGNLGTQTFTEIEAESTDPDVDLPPPLQGTATFTKVTQEQTDRD